MTKKSLIEKLTRITADPTCGDFILADAKDADMAFGVSAPGRRRNSLNGGTEFRSLAEFHESICEIVEQGLVDVMLMSVNTSARLTIDKRLFENRATTPAIRANDTTDIWLAGGVGTYGSQPSLPFRSATIDHAMCGHANCTSEERRTGADLGLYSITFNNDATLDLAALETYREFRIEAEEKGFRHFLEVFAPNASKDLSPEDIPRFINDSIVRTLAGIPPSSRPEFLKIPYLGPAPMEELVAYDSSLVVGILGGSSGTTFDAFHQLWEAKKHGARVALYGRMINNSEHQLSFIEHLRYLADGHLSDPVEAVRSYHGALQNLNIEPFRNLEDDLQSTNRYFDYSSKKKPSANLQMMSERHRPEVIVAGHVCLDIIPAFPQNQSMQNAAFDPGTLKVMGPAECVTGGCVANTGLTLHHLGIQTLLMGKIGDDPFGEQVLRIVQKADATLAEGMIVAPDEHTSYSIVISPPGVDRSFLHFPGANDTFSASDVRLEQFDGTKLFHFGYPPLMERFWNDGGAEMSKLFRSVKERGVMTSLDMAMPDAATPAGQIDWYAWLAQVLPHVDLFMPSLDEILFMLDPKQKNGVIADNEIERADGLNSSLLSKTADQLISLGAGIVVLKLGSHGLYLKSTTDTNKIIQGFYPGKSNLDEWVGRELYAPCFEVPVASTNGAGDRTIAGFLAAIVHDTDPIETLQMAVAVGAVCVESSCSSMAQYSWELLENRIRAGWDRRPVSSEFADLLQCKPDGCWIGTQDQPTSRTLLNT